MWIDILHGNKEEHYETFGVPRLEMQDWSNDSGGFNMMMAVRQSDQSSANLNTPLYKDFVTPADAGRWMHCVYQLTSDENNGVIRFWRKWENEGYTLINELVNANTRITGKGYQGWGGGYLMGWANATYTANTEWLLDDFTISTTSLLENAPKPPSSVTAK